LHPRPARLHNDRHQDRSEGFAVPVRIAIIDDDRITRESLATLVRRDPELELVSAHADAESAIRDLALTPPDIAVVDVNLAPPGSTRLNGAACVAALRAGCPTLRAIMLTVYDDHDRIFESLRAGAAGYILKRTPPAEIIAAIKELHAGGAPMSLEVARRVVDSFHNRDTAPRTASLTAREREILDHLAKGDTAKEIAGATGVTTGTVRVHLHAIYRKLGVDNRTQAVNVYLGRK
jgi:DNA-binding NarL/FixJ family response regulator